MILNRPSCTYKNGQIHVSMEFPQANNFTQYAFYLYNSENVIIEKIMYTKNSFCCFNITKKDTLYMIKAFVKYKNSEGDEYQKISINSSKILIPSKELEQEFNAYIETKEKPIDYQLPFWHSKYPYQDILVSYSFSNNHFVVERIQDFANEVRLHTVNNEYLTIAATQQLYSLSEPLVAFSGITRNTNKLIYGWKDIDKTSETKDIEEQIGNYFAILNENGVYSIQADYLGFSKIYYYKDDNVLLISNRYHMLLLAMSALNIPRSLNHDKVYSYLSKNNQIMMQNFTRELNIKGTYVLPVDSKIVINTNSHNVSIEKTSLFYDLSAPLPYNLETYDQLLQEAADELIDNAKIALESPHFDQYIVDVTGGLDSRICLCVLTKFPQFKDKIIPHTALGKGYEKDSEIALKLLSKTSFHFRKAMVSIQPERDIDAEAMSCILGTTIEYSKYHVSYKDTLSFQGDNGEVTGRPYYSAIYLDSDLSDMFLPSKLFYKSLINRQGGTLYEADELTAKLFYEECCMLPGRTNLEKYENHYLYYRNAIHFSDLWRSSIMCSCWSILQSKKMLKLKYMLFPYDSIKLQLDMLYLLNSEIAAVEFSSDKYNAQRRELNMKYQKYPQSTTYDENKIEMLRSELKNTRSMNKNCNINDFNKYYSDELVLKMLNLLVNHSDFDRDIAFNLFWYIKNQKNDTRRIYTMRKICSLYFELNC